MYVQKHLLFELFFFSWCFNLSNIYESASEMTGMGSPIGSVAAGTGSPIGQWRLLRGGASPHIRPPPLPLAAPGSEKPPVPQGYTGIGFTVSARSPAPALRLVVVVPQPGPPVLAAIGGGTTTSLLRLRHDK